MRALTARPDQVAGKIKEAAAKFPLEGLFCFAKSEHDNRTRVFVCHAARSAISADGSTQKQIVEAACAELQKPGAHLGFVSSLLVFVLLTFASLYPECRP